MFSVFLLDVLSKTRGQPDINKTKNLYIFKICRANFNNFPQKVPDMTSDDYMQDIFPQLL